MPTKQELEKELKETKALLFLGVRNMTVLPKGLLLGKSEQEICAMTLSTIEEMKAKINYETVYRLMEMGAKYGTNKSNK